MEKQQVVSVDPFAATFVTSPAALPAIVVKHTSQAIDVRKTLTLDMYHQAEEYAAAVNFMNGTQVLLFGASAQNNYKEAMLSLLQGVRAGDLGLTGDLAASLNSGIDILDIETMQKEVTPGTRRNRLVRFCSGAPLIGSWLALKLSAIRQFAARQQEFVEHIRVAEKLAKDDAVSINEYLQKMEGHVVVIEQNFRDLAVWIVAGEIAVERGKGEYESMAREALEREDPIAKTHAQRYGEEVLALDDRVLLFKTQFVRAPISMQRVTMQQEGGRQEIRNIMSGLLSELPNLVEAALEVAGLSNLQRAQGNRQALERVSDRIGRLRDDLQDQTLETAMQGRNRALARVEALREQMERVVKRMGRREELLAETAVIKDQADEALREIAGLFADAHTRHAVPIKLTR